MSRLKVLENLLGTIHSYCGGEYISNAQSSRATRLKRGLTIGKKVNSGSWRASKGGWGVAAAAPSPAAGGPNASRARDMWCLTANHLSFLTHGSVVYWAIAADLGLV